MRLRSSHFVLVLALCSSVALAQTPPAASTPPADPAPAAQAPASSGPAVSTPAPAAAAPAPSSSETPAQPQQSTTVQPAPTPAPANPAPAQQTARTTLFPNPSDPTGVEEGVLTAKPAVVLAGTSTWDEAFDSLKNAVAKLDGELKKAGISPTGRPLTIFVDTDDNGFKFEAMIPIAQVPEGKTELTPEIKFGKTPEGKAFRFVHKDAYDEIDGTYETITAYLDIKEIVAKDAFIEEYVSEFTDSQDTNFEVNIYVQPK
ncbi:AraC family transcriptional regulator [Microvirga sp. KLBC 81]|uniref:GyrI-like domain-containing protein n=1 Tax=Microvirga sp. KLBC 81 TaxID=1862707 RepID=UPI000D50C6DA|nr:GyrI-like domain-containing protein [Microvirga sp. KLBC 81]PVE24452.1 AraC family transcriptional regulator [Microvirga sp. KLBC 81]